MEYPEEKKPPDVITSDTNNATTIQPDEAPAHKQYKFKRFRAYNTGTWNGPKRENKEVVRRQDNLHRFDSLSSTLRLNDYQKKRGRKLFDTLDVRSIGWNVDAIIFAVCVLVVNDDVPDGSRYYPNQNTPDDAVFDRVGSEIGYEDDQLVSIIEKIRGRINL
jgi:hypothetical protein